MLQCELANQSFEIALYYYFARGELEEYMALLVRSFNPNTLDKLMCRSIINVDYEGRIFDCDFNQQLELQVNNDSGTCILCNRKYILFNNFYTSQVAP